MTEPLGRRLAAEGIGSFFLFAAVIGSGVMAEALAGGNVAVALLGNTLATGAILFVLITMLGPISGAHFNPAVTLVMASRGELPWRDAAPYIAAQLAWRHAGRLGRASDVRPADPAIFGEGAIGHRPMDRRSGRHLRPDPDHPRHGPASARLGASLGRALHHRRPIGSPHRPASPTRRSPSPAACPTPSPASRRMTCRCLSWPNCSVRRLLPWSVEHFLTSADHLGFVEGQSTELPLNDRPSHSFALLACLPSALSGHSNSYWEPFNSASLAMRSAWRNGLTSRGNSGATPSSSA